MTELEAASLKILEMRNIIKSFGNYRALDEVCLTVKKGSIHAIVGENGAGKSTLMNVLSGVYPYGSYSGEILFGEKPCHFQGIKDSESCGIAIIHQELTLIPELTVYENIFLGNEQKKGIVIDFESTRSKALDVLKRLELEVDINAKIKELGIGKQQLVEIAKALRKNAKLLILDEPTAVLSDEDSQRLLVLMESLKSEGVTCILISHKLQEIEQVADEITVIRDGKTICTLPRGCDKDEMICAMIGRELQNRYPKRDDTIQDKVGFALKDWTVYDPLTGKKRIDGANLQVKKGEVVGIAGISGAGRSELFMSVFGGLYGDNISGQVLKNGVEISTKTVKEAISNRIAYLPEDRKQSGLVLIDSIKDNATLASLTDYKKKLFIDDAKEQRIVNYYAEELEIKCRDIFQLAGELSGGNQQKILLAKWLLTKPEVLILDEPTRGIDIGAKYEIYLFINDQAALGKSIILISSDMDELLGLSDRAYVLSNTKIVAELSKSEMSAHAIMDKIVTA